MGTGTHTDSSLLWGALTGAGWGGQVCDSYDRDISYSAADDSAYGNCWRHLEPFFCGSCVCYCCDRYILYSTTDESAYGICWRYLEQVSCGSCV